MTITGNRAAWQTAAEKRPLEVGPAPNPDPAENEVVIRVAYAAVNSCDWNMQLNPYWEMGYPVIWGTDVSGTIVQLGVNITRFKVGQRVIGQCDSLVTRKVPNAGFQLYSTCLENFVAAIPDSLPLANAGVLPLAISTSASALFFDHKLPFPTLKPKSTGKTLLVWGGSSSIGCSAIQLAIAAGCNVVATASKANFELVTSLGATKVFDYKDPNVVDEILKNLKPDDFIFNCIGTKETQSVCAEILGKLGGGKIPTLNPPQVPVPENVVPNFVNGLDPGLVNLEIGEAVWGKYVPKALAAGRFQAKPDPLIVKGGLEKIQEAMDLLRKGVSAKKIIVEISKE